MLDLQRFLERTGVQLSAELGSEGSGVFPESSDGDLSKLLVTLLQRRLALGNPEPPPDTGEGVPSAIAHALSPASGIGRDVASSPLMRALLQEDAQLNNSLPHQAPPLAQPIPGQGFGGRMFGNAPNLLPSPSMA